MGRLGQVTAVLALVTIGAVATGCASKNTPAGDTPPADAIRAAAGLVSSAKTVRVHGSMGGASPSLTVDGTVRFGPEPGADLRITTPTKGGKLTLGTGTA